MDEILLAFFTHLRNVKKASANTISSYGRDLRSCSAYLTEHHLGSLTDAKETSLLSYVLFLEQSQRAAATISRNIASLRAFYQFLIQQGLRDDNPADALEGPTVKRQPSSPLLREELNRLLSFPDAESPRGGRDLTMIYLLCTTGIPVSDLVSLVLSNVHLIDGYLEYETERKTKTVSLTEKAALLLSNYLQKQRPFLVRPPENHALFLNYNGTAMSRQGFWKVLKGYAAQAGLADRVTPQSLRHTFLRGLDHDISTTQNTSYYLPPQTTISKQQNEC